MKKRKKIIILIISIIIAIALALAIIFAINKNNKQVKQTDVEITYPTEEILKEVRQ